MKKALVLMNFGGPRSLDDVASFLKDLFSDPCVFEYPSWIRRLLAHYIAKKRAKSVAKSYALMGGRSLVFESTEKQSKALREKLNHAYDVFCAMRYGSPSIKDVIGQLKDYKPQEVLLLPMYPHFSLTTTLSCFKEWEREVKRQAFSYPTKRICCYPKNDYFVKAHGEIILDAWKKVKPERPVRLLFSAHGIPMKFVSRGDPYCSHIENSCRAILSYINKKGLAFSDWQLCYQSRVGPLAWTEPYLDDELSRAAKDKKDVFVVPISFVGEHLETLVELDVEYKEKAEALGLAFFRAPALENHPSFIEGLAQLVRHHDHLPRSCPVENNQCWRYRA